jgi:tetratricopeptide (TPR) repeat protein
MRISAGLGASLLGAALSLSCPPAASAEGDRTWQACIGATSVAHERVSSCSSVIDSGTETPPSKCDPMLAIAYGNRGYLHYRKHEMSRAIEDYSVQIKLRPDVLGYINRGNAWRDSEQLDRAAADYGEVIRLAPTDPRGWRNRGMIRLYKGDNKGGLADYDKAVQYDPADVFSWNNRGQAKLRLGDKAGAIADFRKALELRPDLSTARASLRQLGVAP